MDLPVHCSLQVDNPLHTACSPKTASENCSRDPAAWDRGQNAQPLLPSKLRYSRHAEDTGEHCMKPDGPFGTASVSGKEWCDGASVHATAHAADGSTFPPSGPLTFAQLATLPHSHQFRAAQDVVIFGKLAAMPSRLSTPTPPATLAVTSEPSSLANLSPSLLRTPPTTSGREGHPGEALQHAPLQTEEVEYSTPEHTLGTASLSGELQTQVWAPCRMTPVRSRLHSLRRFSDTSSEVGSPQPADFQSPPWHQCLRMSIHGECNSSDDGVDAGAGRLVCNLVERFNNAQLYDDINTSP